MNVRYLERHETVPFAKTSYQSRGWIEVTAKEGIPSYRFIVEQDGSPMVYSAVYVYPLGRLGNQLYIPRGPIILDGCEPKHLHRFAQEIKDLCQKHAASFAMIEPDLMSQEHQDLLTSFTSPCAKERIPHQTHKIDTTQPEEDVLADMKSKTRYNVNLARKKGVQVTTYLPDHPDLAAAFDAFHTILAGTADRGGFHIHSRDHYLTILTTQTENFTPYLMIAEHEGTPLAANMMLDTIDETIYLHGGSSNQKRNLMAPYLLQWEGISHAIKTKKQSYDFWGTSDTKSSWSGLTKFKRGFGGFSVSYPDTRAIVANPALYLLYRLYTKLRS